MARTTISFDEFVSANADGLLRTACLIVWDEKEAEDLVQESLFKVARRWERVAAMDEPLAYARRILINLALRGSINRARRRVELGASIPDAAPDFCAPEALATRDEVRAAIGELTSRQRTVLVLRYFHDLPEGEVADMLGCSVGTVKSTAHRALARLRELMAESTPVKSTGDHHD